MDQSRELPKNLGRRALPPLSGSTASRHGDEVEDETADRLNRLRKKRLGRIPTTEREIEGDPEVEDVESRMSESRGSTVGSRSSHGDTVGSRSSRGDTVDGDGRSSRTPGRSTDRESARSDGGKKRRRRRRQPEISSGELPEELELPDDDYIAESVPEPPLPGAPPPSKPLTRVFIETKSGFKPTKRSRLARLREAETEADPELGATAVSAAVVTERIFSNFCLFIHGLLSGFALVQTILVFVMPRKSPNIRDFLGLYESLSMATSILFYTTVLLCTLSALDRWDPLHNRRGFFRSFLTFHPGAIASVIYLTALVITSVAAPTDDRIGLFSERSNVTWDLPSTDPKGTLENWQIYSAVRCVTVGLGWFVIASSPYVNDLVENLQEMGDFDFSLVPTRRTI